MELKYIVYITINLCNGKFYIGVHKTNPDVFDGYIGCGINTQSDAVKNRAFHRAVKKYGYKNFIRTTIRTFPNTQKGMEQAFKLEEILVNKTLLKSKNCYNEALGGKGSPIQEEMKTVYMFDLKGEYLRSFKSARTAAETIAPNNIYVTMKAIRNNCLGISNSSNGYFWSYKKEFTYQNNCQVKIAQYTFSGKFLRYYDSITEAEQLLGINTIQQAITRKIASGGYQWRYYDGDNSDISQYISVKNKNTTLPILMLTKEGNLIKEYACVKDCCKENHELTASQVNRVLKGIIRSHKGFVFKYKDEDIVQLYQK